MRHTLAEELKSEARRVDAALAAFTIETEEAVLGEARQRKAETQVLCHSSTNCSVSFIFYLFLFDYYYGPTPFLPDSPAT